MNCLKLQRDFNSLDDEEFIKITLNTLKYNIDLKKQNILGKKRLNKFIVFLAESLDYKNLTYGWYKYGFYSPDVNKKMNEFQLNTLYDYAIYNDINIHREYEKHLERYINEYKNIFLNKQELFDKWVYRRAPQMYKNFYDNFNSLYAILNTLYNYNKNEIKNEDVYNTIEEDITNCYNSINHVHDGEIFNVFCHFTDILENLILILRLRDKFKEINPYLNKLLKIFDENIYPFLTPYEETITGPSKDREILIFRDRKKIAIRKANSKLTDLEKELRDQDLWPTFCELKNYSKNLYDNLNEKQKKELKKIFLSTRG